MDKRFSETQEYKDCLTKAVREVGPTIGGVSISPGNCIAYDADPYESIASNEGFCIIPITTGVSTLEAEKEPSYFGNLFNSILLSLFMELILGFGFFFNLLLGNQYFVFDTVTQSGLLPPKARDAATIIMNW